MSQVTQLQIRGKLVFLRSDKGTLVPCQFAEDLSPVILEEDDTKIVVLQKKEFLEKYKNQDPSPYITTSLDVWEEDEDDDVRVVTFNIMDPTEPENIGRMYDPSGRLYFLEDRIYITESKRYLFEEDVNLYIKTL